MNIQGYRPSNDNDRIRANNEQLLQVHVPEAPAPAKRDRLALISGLLSVVFLVILWPGYFNISNNGDSGMFTGLASIIMTLFVLPHMLLLTVGFIFNALYWFSRAVWCALVAAILYTIAGAILFSWAYDIVIQMALCYIIVATEYKTKAH